MTARVGILSAEDFIIKYERFYVASPTKLRVAWFLTVHACDMNDIGKPRIVIVTS